MSPERSSRSPGAPASSGALPDRRRFLGLLGAAAAVPFAVAALPALAQSPPAAPTTTPPSVPPPAAPEKKLSEDAKSLLEIAKRRFGKNLDKSQLESIAADLQDGLDSGEALRKLALGNSDEPDVVFRALPPEV